MLVRPWYGKLVRHILFFGTYRNVPVLLVRTRIPQLSPSPSAGYVICELYNPFYTWLFFISEGVFTAPRPFKHVLTSHVLNFLTRYEVWGHCLVSSLPHYLVWENCPHLYYIKIALVKSWKFYCCQYWMCTANGALDQI